MIGVRDPAYLRRRALEERTRAAAAADRPARIAHDQLAALYDREAEDADGRAGLPPTSPVRGALFMSIER